MKLLFRILLLAAIYHAAGHRRILLAQDMARPGLLWVQYHSTDFQRMNDIGIDAQVDMDFRTQYRDFSRLWIGRLRGPADGIIEVEAEADNGLRLFIDGRPVIDGWSEKRRTGRFEAAGGEWLPFRLEYFQDGGNAVMRLMWSWEGAEKALIPESAFSHTGAQRDTVNAWAKEIQMDLTPELREDHSAIYGSVRADTVEWSRPHEAVPVFPGPHLMVGDYLIESVENTSRFVRKPERDEAVPNPVVKSDPDRSFQPYLSVLKDTEKGGFRMWYGAFRPDSSESRSHLALIRSADGIHWERPHMICNTPEIQFGSEVIDRTKYWYEPDSRYVYMYWLEGGLRLLKSADGMNWDHLTEGTVLDHNHDINNIWWDPLRKKYVATMSTIMRSPRWTGRRRTTIQSVIGDLLTWTDPAYVLYADPGAGDEGRTEFYAMNGYIARGPVVIGMVKVLRDDVIATGVEEDAYGTGYTTLAWSYDGEHWMRDQTPFFEPDPSPDAWDHSHAWIDEQVAIGDSVCLYYGGYKQGHKKNRFSERQIGLVKMARDRYAGWKANSETGKIITAPFLINGPVSRLTVNMEADNGTIRIGIKDADTGKTIGGLSTDACEPVRGNGLDLPVSWELSEESAAKIRDLESRSVVLVFELEGDARLYAFEFHEK